MVTASGPRRLQVDVAIATRGSEHVDEIVAEVRTVVGVQISKVSDRTFLMHLGGML
jgi:malate dehydrogenase (oxaloacetate-decarboxylating)